MKVFLSWSGSPSKELAEIFYEWLPSVLQAVRPYFSPDGIDKGTRWSVEIAGELDACDLGLLFLTSNNLKAPWIMFEAGALSKKLERGRVSPLLFSVGTTDLEGPLTQFQATPFTKEEMQKLVEDLNNCLGEQSLSDVVVTNTFTKWWPDLEQKVSTILHNKPAEEVATPRSERELLEETLELVRGLSNVSTSPVSSSNRFAVNVANKVNQLLVSIEGLKKQIAAVDVFDEHTKSLEDLEKLAASVFDLIMGVEEDIASSSTVRAGRRIHNLDEFIELWPAVLVRIKRKIGVTAVAYLHDAVPVTLTEDEAVLEFKKKFHYEKACEAAKRLPFEQILNECLASPRRLQFSCSVNSENNE